MVVDVPGDGVLDVSTLPEKGVVVATEETTVDVRQSLIVESVQAHQSVMNESKMNGVFANNLLRTVAVKKYDQVDAIESSAVEKVLQAGK